ncbi:MAG: HAMP domain-containing histidine kinase [Acidimicrobiia bacterium]|nr:HAMP domain-containing histidine kinase [Acidimicrobiia bacterium]
MPDPVPVQPELSGDAGPSADVARLRRRLAREHRIRLEAEEIAEKTITRLYDADQLKNVFLATISHELRTPLTSIVGFTSLLLEAADQIDDEQRHDMLQRIDRNAHVLISLIEDLLQFSTLEQQNGALDPEAISLRPLALAVVGQLGPTLDQQTIDVAIPDGIVVLADEQGLVRVLTNLLTNASRYAPAGTVVTLGARLDEGRCVLTVDDEGPGVPEDERALVFERFFRGRGDWVTKTHGTGIGLAVVQRLVDAMGGEIEVADAPGGGARFTVTLPAAPPSSSA